MAPAREPDPFGINGAAMDATPGPEIRDIDAALTNHIAVEFGQHGVRAVAFLQSAHNLLASDLEVPTKGELIAYSIREALKSLLDSQAPAVRRRSSDVPIWSKLSRRVAAAHAAWEAVSPDTVESADATLVKHANDSLHGAVSVEVAADYWSRTVARLEVLFMPGRAERPVASVRDHVHLMA